MAFVEEKSADMVFYVEDEMAEYAAEPLLQLVLAEKFQQGAHFFPKVEVVPIGGFQQVINFLKRHNALHRPSVKSYALLDADVRDEVVAAWTAAGDHTKLAWLQEYDGRIHYLPWTPEVGIVNLYLEHGQSLLMSLRQTMSQTQLHFSDDQAIPTSIDRAFAKMWVRHQLFFWSEHFAISELEAKRALGSVLAKAHFEAQKPQAMSAYAALLA